VGAVAILLALLAVAVVGALVLAYRRRVRSSGSASLRSSSSRTGGRLAQRVEQAHTGEEVAGDRYVDHQAAVWESSGGGRPGRPVLFEEDLGRPDPRSPEAYDVSGLYADERSPAGFDESVEDAVDDLAEADYRWDEPGAQAEGEADRAFAADLDEVDEDLEHDRFAPRRSPVEQGPAGEDEFVAELLGGGEADAAGSPDDPRPAGDPAEPLERRTPKAAADAYRQPLRLARTQQRPTGANRRSPEQMRAMLLNYRGGMKKGREEPHDGSMADEP
jgi:hypothetical protein